MKAALPLLPGATGPDGQPQALGVLGGGQLGRMFVHAAQAMGFITVVLDPDPASPAGRVAHHHIQADYLDPSALDELARRCTAVTTEFENVPAAALERLAVACRVAPGAAAVAPCQHRAEEKRLFARAGVPCAPWAFIQDLDDLATADASLLPGILKTAQMGYDGKGQARVQDRDQLAQAWQSLGGVPCVLERKLALVRELSVIVARGHDGQVVHLPVMQNLHRDGILAVTQVPAPDIDDATAGAALAAARSLAGSMGYEGVLCVEFFVLADGSLVANEMAPRPHNSGHGSIEACDVSQFELQVRALAGLPMPQPRLQAPAVMLNLLGDLWFERRSDTPRTPPWDAVLALPGAHLHLYSKAQPRPGRKMGHLTVTAQTAAQANAVAQQAARLLELPGLD